MKIRKNILEFIKLFRNPRTFILLIVVIALSSISIFLFATRPTQIDRLGVSYLELLDKETVDKNIQPSYKDSFKIKDYVIYGENLTLYNEPYSNTTDTMQGMSVVLRNIETTEETSFTFSGGVDSGINLGALKQGLYEIYAYDNYVKKRVYFKDKMESKNFSTMRRNEKVMNIRLIANKDYLDKFGFEMDKNYVFLSVVENVPMRKIIDVLIDPCGNVYNEQTNQIDYGVGNDKINEASESYEFALLIKEKLEAAGLRVALTREKDGTPSYYGKSGRAGIGYEAQAKIFLSLGMLVDENITRPIMMISPYTNGLLANDISFNLANEEIYLPDISAKEHLNLGVMYDALNIDEDGNMTQYEMYPQLRETGGKSTFAGQLPTAKSNQIYKDSFGMESLYFMYANLGRLDSIDYYFEYKEKIATVIANSIINFYEIDEVTDETTTK